VSLTGQLLGAEVASRAPALAGRVAPRWLSDAVLREWGRLAHQPHGTRLPMKEALRHPAALAQALRIRWPNPVEATFECRGPFNDAARFPYQVWAGVRRGLRFGRLAVAGSPS